MMEKFGFIGCGNMATAIIKGLLGSNVKAENIIVFDKDTSKCKNFSGVNIANNCKEVAEWADTVIFAIKPVNFDDVLGELAGVQSPLYISIAAGISINFIQSKIGENARVIRVMPNTPALIGKGMTVLSYGNVTENDICTGKNIFASIGEIVELDEKYMDAVVGVSGSGPAYIYMMVEAMAKAGVNQGLPYDLALKLATQTCIGGGEMIKSTGESPKDLTVKVCSPGGTTIEAVNALNDGKFDNIVNDAIAACSEKSKQLTR